MYGYRAGALLDRTIRFVCIRVCVYIYIYFFIYLFIYSLLLSLLLLSLFGWGSNARRRKAKPPRASQSLSETFLCTDFKTLLSARKSSDRESRYAHWKLSASPAPPTFQRYGHVLNKTSHKPRSFGPNFPARCLPVGGLRPLKTSSWLSQTRKNAGSWYAKQTTVNASRGTNGCDLAWRASKSDRTPVSRGGISSSEDPWVEKFRGLPFARGQFHHVKEESALVETPNDPFLTT